MSKAVALQMTRPEIGITATPDRVVVTMTWPSTEWMKALTPHAEGHWRTKAPATKWLRREVATKARAAHTGKPWPRAGVAYTFLGRRRGGWDEANMVQRMKPVIDGLKDGGVIVDDDWTRLHIEGVGAGKDAKYPRIMVTIYRRQCDD